MSGTIGFGMVDPVLNNRRNKWYQKRNAVKIPRRAICKKYLDAKYTLQGGGASGQSAFGNTAPAAPQNEPGNFYSMGTVFKVLVAGKVTHVRSYKHAASVVVNTEIAIYAVGNGVPLSYTPVVAFPNTGWNDLKLTTPVNVTPGTNYIAAAYCSDGKYAATVGAFNSNIGSGNVIAPSSASVGGNGRYKSGPGFGIPDQLSANAAWYGVDVLFTPS